MSHQQIIHGDMFEETPKIADGSVDCVFLDLPYGEGDKSKFEINRECKNYVSIHEAWDKNTDGIIERMHEHSINEAWRVLKPGGIFFLTCSNQNKPLIYKYAGNNSRADSKGLGEMPNFRWLNDVTWSKINAMPFMFAKQLVRMAPSCEYVVIYGKGLPSVFEYEWLKQDKTKEELLLFPPKKNGQHTQLRDLWIINTEGGAAAREGGFDRHPAQKPMKMLDRIILGYTKPGDLIADWCCGSGVIGARAKIHGRSFIGIEKDERWAVSAQRRLESVEDRLALVA